MGGCEVGQFNRAFSPILILRPPPIKLFQFYLEVHVQRGFNYFFSNVQWSIGTTLSCLKFPENIVIVCCVAAKNESAFCLLCQQNFTFFHNMMKNRKKKKHFLELNNDQFVFNCNKERWKKSLMSHFRVILHEFDLW
jgi:hypothetical protein